MSNTAIPWTAACQTPLSMGILPARVMEWVAMPSSRGSPQPRDRTQVSCIAGGFFISWATSQDQCRLAEAYFCLNVLLVESVCVFLCSLFVMRQHLMTVRMWQNRKPSTSSFHSFIQISLPTQPRLHQLLCQFHKWVSPVSSGESQISPTPHCHFGSPIFLYFIPHTSICPFLTRKPRCSFLILLRPSQLCHHQLLMLKI